MKECRITLSGRNGSDVRTVFANDAEIGTVSRGPNGWQARCTRGQNHGDYYTSDWNAAKQLALGLGMAYDWEAITQ